MTTIEEMVETFEGARQSVRPSAGWHVRAEAGMLAVIEKHIGPMLHGAYTAGFSDGCDDERGKMRLKYDGGSDYAARIISDLTAPDPISRIADETESSNE